MADIRGTQGNDTLYGTDDDDIVSGFDGNDLIYGSFGADVLDGGAGDDVFRFQSIRFSSTTTPRGRIDGGAGFDVLDLRGISPVVIGSIENNLFGAYIGSQKYEIANVERIYVGGGDDSISTDFGAGVTPGMEVFAGAGNDRFSGTGAINFYGEEGDDQFFMSGTFGAATSGTVDGGSGYDTLKTNIGFTVDLATQTAVSYSATYRIVGIEAVLADPNGGYASTVLGDGNDNYLGANPIFADGTGVLTLDGRGGNDTLLGGAGNDLLTGGTGTNSIDGGPGTDTGIMLGRYGDYTTSQTGAVTSFVNGNGQESNSFTNVEKFRFGDGIVVTAGANGSDYFDLSVKTGAVVVAAGAGDDIIFAGGGLTGADRIDGGVGGRDVIALQGDYSGARALTLQAGTIANFENLVVVAGDDYVITSDDSLVAAGQQIIVTGNNLGAGDDFTFNGAAELDGAFTFFGGQGVDILTGGARDDGFYFGPDKFGANDRVSGGGGNDALGLDGHTGPLVLDAVHTDVEALALLRGPDGADAYGTITVDDSWVAAGQTKTITAVTSFQSSVGPVLTNLVIDGAGELDGNLRILGGSGDDMLAGGGGDDLLFGGLGRDTLTGNGGRDTFVFNAAGDSASLGFDTLVGFTAGTDVIQIDGQAHDSFTTVNAGQLSDSSFDSDLATALNAGLVGGTGVFFNVTSGDHAGQTFLVVNSNGADGYQAGEDLVLRIVTPPPAAETLPPDFMMVGPAMEQPLMILPATDHLAPAMLVDSLFI